MAVNLDRTAPPAPSNGKLHPASAPSLHRITLDTERSPGFYDITDEVTRAVEHSGVVDGLAIVFSRHTTAAIRINENEPCLLLDMEDFLARVAPASTYYRHNDRSVRLGMEPNEPLNGHAHCAYLLLSASEMIPIEGGELMLGTWQRVFLVELDSPRRREVLVQIIRS